LTVSVSDALPGQPTVGSSVYRPLGGDGFTAPLAQYSVLQQLTGDATGARSNVTLGLDDRWMSIVSLLEIHLTGGGSVREGIMEVRADRPSSGVHRARGFGQMIFLSTLSSEGLLSWNPPIVLDALSIFYTTVNVDTAIMNCRAQIYCFQKRALEEVPLNVILASLPSTQYINSNTG